MNVDNLIKELEKIKDKTKTVYFDDEEWGCTEVAEVAVNEGGSYEVVLKK